VGQEGYDGKIEKWCASIDAGFSHAASFGLSLPTSSRRSECHRSHRVQYGFSKIKCHLRDVSDEVMAEKVVDHLGGVDMIVEKISRQSVIAKESVER